MDPRRVTERGIGYDQVVGGRVSGYELRFEKQSRDYAGGGHANLAYALGGAVEGVVYRLSDADEISKMDPFERAPINYSREAVRVATQMGDVWAWTYFANPAVIRPHLKPPGWYMDHLLAGETFLSDAYVAWLRSLECV